MRLGAGRSVTVRFKSAAELEVRCDIDGDLDMPLSAVAALSAAAGEALRNVAAHAGVRAAALTACRKSANRTRAQKRKRARCEARARQRYGPPRSARRHAKGGRK